MFLYSHLKGFSLKFCNIKETDLPDSWLTYVAAHPIANLPHPVEENLG